MDSTQQKYLREVLGIQSFMMPLEPTSENMRQAPQTDPIMEYESQNIIQGEHLKIEGRGSILFLGTNLHSNNEANTLLNKMIQAMGLSSPDVMIAELNPNFIEDFKTDIWNEILSTDCQLGVFFGEELHHYLFNEVSQDWNGKWASKNTMTCLSTWDPSTLLLNAKLKRTAWLDLKKVITKAEQMEL